MPVSQRISDAELRQRLEDHNYNVPPITDSTRRTLINKLRQLDQESAQRSRKQKVYTGLDYSSAEDDEFPAPRASSTMVGGRSRGESGRGRMTAAASTAAASASTSGGGASNGGRRATSVQQENRRGGRGSRQNSRAGTPQTNGGTNNGGGGRVTTRRREGLMHNSETEEGSEEEEDEEEEDICEEEEEEEEDESEEEEVNGGGGGGSDRVDLGVQTSLLESPSPTVSSPSTHTQRFRGQSYGSTPTSGPPYSSTPTYPMSSYLRHRMNSNSSLGEALATLPSPPTPSNKSKTPDSPASLTTQATPQRGGGGGYHRHNTSSGANDSLSTGSKLISTFIIAAAAVFFLILAWKYFSLVPSTGVKSIPICGAGGVPHVDCVPHRELNDTVSLYKKLLALLPAPEGCSKDEEGSLSTTEVVNSLVDFKPKVEHASVENLLRNLVLLLKQHPDWGVAVSETETWEETTLSVVSRPQTWLCWASELSSMMWAFVLSVAGWIFAALLLLLVLWAVYVLYRRTVVRREREKREAFALVEQATDILFRQHQVVGREGKGGHSFLAIDHIRDQLIPPQERSDKAEVWSKAVAYIRTHESRVREDVQHIFGEEFRVWQWLPDLAWSPGSPSPSPRSSVRAPSMGSPQTPATPQNQWPHVPTTTVPGWQGEAFTHNKQVGAPLAPPTSCLKVRHLFDAQHQSPGWVNEVREEILRRCAQAKILHIAVDTQSEEGTVYIKTLSTEEAGKVFGCLHGQWYRGQLVTAKYLRLERYHERFPDSKNSFVPMRPSN